MSGVTEQIRAILNEEGCNVREIAARGGLSARPVEMFRDGISESMRSKQFERLCRALGYTLTLTPADREAAVRV